MAVQRIQIANNKRINGVKHQKQKISVLLAEHKDEKARIQVEHIIRDDFTIEGYEVLELMCELVHERIRQVTTSSKDPPEEMKEAIASLIWASKNVDIEEFRNVKQQLRQKYTAEFIKQSETNENGLVNPRLFSKLTYKPPSQFLVVKYLEEIARAYNVDWTPSALLLNSVSEEAHKDGGDGTVEASKDAPFATPNGSSVPMAPASGFSSAYAPTLIQPSNNTRFPGMTVEEEQEMEAANKLRAAGTTYLVPVPGAKSSPNTTPIVNPHIGIPAIPFNPQKSVHQAAASAPTSAVPIATAHYLDDEEAILCQQAAMQIEDEERLALYNDHPNPHHRVHTNIDMTLKKLEKYEKAENADDDAIDTTVAPDVAPTTFFTTTFDETAVHHNATAPPPSVPQNTDSDDPLAALQARLAALNQTK